MYLTTLKLLINRNYLVHILSVYQMMYYTYFTHALFQGFETIGVILILRKQIHIFVFIFLFFFDVFKICQLVLDLRGLTF